jgi:hypothetical protein
MHLICENKSNIFIAMNEFSVASIFNEIKSNNFKDKLTTIYSSPRTTEEKERSKRYATKLERRIFGKKELSGKAGGELDRATFLKKILNKKQICVLPLDYLDYSEETTKKPKATARTLSEKSIKMLTKKLKEEHDKIFFIQVKGCSYKERHSEEFLCDIVAIAKSIAKIEYVHSCIAGKKRPCLGCKGRMDNESISSYGKYPGLFFKHTVQNQSAEVAAQTFENFSGKIYLSAVCEESSQLPVSDFDSGSTSEEYTSESVSDGEEVSSDSPPARMRSKKK